jgi:hypothetical protein
LVKTKDPPWRSEDITPSLSAIIRELKYLKFFLGLYGDKPKFAGQFKIKNKGEHLYG